jgi:hypothetical protein
MYFMTNNEKMQKQNKMLWGSQGRAQIRTGVAGIVGDFDESKSGVITTTLRNRLLFAWRVTISSYRNHENSLRLDDLRGLLNGGIRRYNCFLFV